MPKELKKLFKQYVSKTEVDEDERAVTATITTSAIDRDGEVLQAKGAMLENYLKNPVVLWVHDYYGTPVAKCMWLKKGRKAITAKMRFATAEQSSKAEEVYQLFKGGFLNAFSVGFQPTKSHSPTPDEIKKKPEWAEASRVFDEWELLEFSAVPVPANPEALASAVKTKSVVVSKDTLDELGIDETFYPAENKVEPEVKEIEKPLIETEPIKKHIETCVYLKTHKVQGKPTVNRKEEVDNIMKRLRGRVY